MGPAADRSYTGALVGLEGDGFMEMVVARSGAPTWSISALQPPPHPTDEPEDLDTLLGQTTYLGLDGELVDAVIGGAPSPRGRRRLAKSFARGERTRRSGGPGVPGSGR